MKRILGLALIATLVSGALDAGERVGDFALIDHQGAIQHMAWYNDHSAVVIMPLTNKPRRRSKFKSTPGDIC